MNKKKLKLIISIILIAIISITLIFNKNEDNVFVKDGIIFALTINGEEKTNFPPKGNYKVDVKCENAKGVWLYDKWEFAVENITGNVKCFLDFNTIDENDYLNNYVMSLKNTTQGTGKLVQEIDTVDLSVYTVGDTLTSTEYLSVNNDATYPYTWDDTNLKWISTSNVAKKTSSIEFKVSEAGTYRLVGKILENTSSDKITVYVDGVSKYSNTGSASGTYTRYATLNLTTDSVVKISFYAAKETSNLEVYLHKYPYVEDIRQIDVGYRYQGTDPNNYVLFNNELWRIFGVDDVTLADGSTVKNLAKIVRTEHINGMIFSTTSLSLGADSTVLKMLNGAYYNGENGNDNQCYVNNTYDAPACDFRATGIQDGYRNMIESVTWNLGKPSTLSSSTGIYYHYERTGDTAVGYIGLPYVSDYGYSLFSSQLSRTASIANEITTKSWMIPDKHIDYWFISPSNFAFYFGNKADFTDYPTLTRSNAVLPTLYLKENTYIIHGKGTKNDPYVIGLAS